MALRPHKPGQRDQAPQVQLTHYLDDLRRRITNGISRNISIHLHLHCVTPACSKPQFRHMKTTLWEANVAWSVHDDFLPWHVQGFF